MTTLQHPLTHSRTTRMGAVMAMGVIALSTTAIEVSADEALVPELNQLEAYRISYALDLRHLQVHLDTDDLQYGVLFNKGELSIGDRDTGWKTTLDIPDHQIKLEWNF